MLPCISGPTNWLPQAIETISVKQCNILLKQIIKIQLCVKCTVNYVVSVLAYSFWMPCLFVCRLAHFVLSYYSLIRHSVLKLGSGVALFCEFGQLVVVHVWSFGSFCILDYSCKAILRGTIRRALHSCNIINKKTRYVGATVEKTSKTVKFHCEFTEISKILQKHSCMTKWRDKYLWSTAYPSDFVGTGSWEPHMDSQEQIA